MIAKRNTQSIISIILVLFGMNVLNAQCPVSGYQVFTSNMEIQEFMELYPDCSKLDTLLISNPDISNLDILIQLDSIGTLGLSGLGVKDFDVLSTVSKINRLIISNNDSLLNTVSIPYLGSLHLLIVDSNNSSTYDCKASSISGLKLTSTLSETISFQFSDSIDSMDNVLLDGEINIITENPIYISDRFYLYRNNNYKSYDEIFDVFYFDNLIWHGVGYMDSFSLLGLEKIESSIVYGLIHIDLLDIKDLPDISFSTLDLIIANINDGLFSLSAFSHINALRIYLDNINNLESLDFLDVSSVRVLRITNMKDLIDIDQLNNFPGPLKVNELNISNNALLSDCSIESVCAILQSDFDENDIIISDNLENCDSVDEVLSNCLVPVIENESNDLVLAYPNPTSNFTSISFNLVTPQIIYFKIIDINGKLIEISAPKLYTSSYVKTSIDLSDLKTGSYWITVEGETTGQISSTLVVKQ